MNFFWSYGLEASQLSQALKSKAPGPCLGAWGSKKKEQDPKLPNMINYSHTWELQLSIFQTSMDVDEYQYINFPHPKVL